ncbi:MAG: hypothetical protein AMXMBFR12_09620 [Candidatus Babeliales bacterium]
MKHIMFSILWITFVSNAMQDQKEQEVHWLQDHINKCKKYTHALSDDRLRNCNLVHSYINKFYLPICANQRFRPEGKVHAQKEICEILNNAATDQKFVEELLRF